MRVVDGALVVVDVVLFLVALFLHTVFFDTQDPPDDPPDSRYIRFVFLLPLALAFRSNDCPYMPVHEGGHWS